MDARPVAEALADFAAGFDLTTDDRRDALLARARLHVLDTVGLALAGWRAEDGVGDALVAGLLGAEERGGSTIIGSDVGGTAPMSAMVNGALATVWTFDDIDPGTVMHCEAFATAATLAVAEQTGASGLELLEGFVVATEVALRLASAAHGESGLYFSGFHGTSVFGTVGAAAGAAKLHGLDANGIADAIALSASMAGGTSAGWTAASGRNKTMHPGWAAQAGVVAARLAAAGYGCSHDTIDGERGLLEAHTWREGWSPEPILAGIGEDWRLFDLYVKLHPTGSSTQATADAASILFEEHGIRAGDVQSGTIIVPAQLAQILEDIGDSLYRPSTGSASIGAFPLLVARILMEGGYTLAHRTDAAVREPELLALGDRFAVRADDEHLDLAPEDRPTTVEVVTADRTVRATTTSKAKDFPHDSIVRKFHANAGLALGPAQVDDLAATLLALDELPDVRELTARLAVRADATALG
ncbi:MAG TPA: MmgE/PrpD family protein [Baekduia sp.]|uniref:MmgE/PrpD family protein n=1 Tax=Baekduia sp. TaxID=2600305 RepID=UPI002D7A1DE6|nr:MmgE/PrpD family protein [Baekduia sp.]HET6508981.1 MmgE/PrpD family protein [Baekduia sp.]